MIQTLQHIIFPDDPSLYVHWVLFYRGDRGIIAESTSHEQYLCLGKYQTAEFSTYFNGFSNSKWKKYTNIKKLIVTIDAEGEFDISLCGYNLENNIPIRKELAQFHKDTTERTMSSYEFPDSDEQMLYFEIKTQSEAKIYGGYYAGEFSENNINDVNLALSTTTCWKEEYIKKNVQRIKGALLDAGTDISEHLRIHIVDNGRTLSEQDFPSDGRIELHPNRNTGGSGGFARGMLEAKWQTPKATHVLLMDDDVLIMPDSIYRTFALLRTLKKEYKNHFISGAMLLLEEMQIQHEDIGTVDSEGSFIPLKPRLQQQNLWDNLFNESDFYVKDRQSYQAWWYCCIPMQAIEANGLPMPFFIRGDDCEYSLRCKAKILSMNGICVWHMGFYGKYSASMNIYQECRNLLIAQAASGVIPKANLVGRIKKFYRANILKHDYGAAELALRALEDFMKGPEFIENADGETIVKGNGKLNPKMEPLENFKKTGVIRDDPYWDCRRKFFSKWLYRITYNGHRFFPEFLLNRKPVAIPFDFGYTPGKMAMKRTYLAINPAQKTGCLRPIDKNKFKALQKRYYKALEDYYKNGKKIRARYRSRQKYLTSEEFWRKYLGV